MSDIWIAPSNECMSIYSKYQSGGVSSTYQFLKDTGEELYNKLTGKRQAVDGSLTGKLTGKKDAIVSVDNDLPIKKNKKDKGKQTKIKDLDSK